MKKILDIRNQIQSKSYSSKQSLLQDIQALINAIVDCMIKKGEDYDDTDLDIAKTELMDLLEETRVKVPLKSSSNENEFNKQVNHIVRLVLHACLTIE